MVRTKRHTDFSSSAVLTKIFGYVMSAVGEGRWNKNGLDFSSPGFLKRTLLVDRPVFPLSRGS